MVSMRFPMVFICSPTDTYKGSKGSQVQRFQRFVRFHEGKVLKVFKYPLDREVDEGVRMVMHKGVLINSKTEWFSPSIVKTTIEKGGVEMAYQPAIGFIQSNTRSQSSDPIHPRGRSEVSFQPSERRSQPATEIQPADQPAGLELSAREERMRRR